MANLNCGFNFTILTLLSKAGLEPFFPTHQLQIRDKDCKQK